MAGTSTWFIVPYRGARASADRPAWRTGAGRYSQPCRVDRKHQGRQAARAGGDHRNASEALPDIPTVGEFVPGYEASSGTGVGAPKDTPAEIVERLNKEITAALADPGVKARLADFGGAPMPMTPADFGGLIADETEKWGKVIRAANIKAE